MVTRRDKVTAKRVPNSSEMMMVAKNVMRSNPRSLQAPILKIKCRSSGSSERRESTATKMMEDNTALGK